MTYPKRTVTCGELRESDVGKSVVLNAWVANVRDLGGLVFIDARDRYGLTQIVVEPENDPDLAKRVQELKSEYVVWFKGTVRKRSNPNPKIPTGLIEIKLEDFGVINESKLPPFEITDDVELTEETRLKYRYLDLRRPSAQKFLKVRNELYQITHRYFNENGFLEIETPFLMKSTPEGARDFLTPSRINKGTFYALPQSPQIYKQLLMIAGFDKYVQITKCFRDEDLRSDRQPEFTQIDLEMSFADENDVISLLEGFFKRVWKEILGVELSVPFPRISYDDAMAKYGSDKPDARFGMELKDITDLASKSGFNAFASVAKNGGVVCAFNAENCAKYSRKKIDELTEFAKKRGAKGLAWMKYVSGEVKSPIAKFFKDDEIKRILEILEAKDGDLILFAADEKASIAQTVLGALRLEIAKEEGLLEKVADKYSFLWVVDFPLLEYDEERKRNVALHHPFTSPRDEDIPLLETEPLKAKARAYDIVVNGAEIGGGSVRIHKTDVQAKMFAALDMSEEEARDKFGFFLEALEYGTPPHAGIALGLDRIAMSLCGTENIRDVIAFPKTTKGLSLMDGAPSRVADEQLFELGIKVLDKYAK